MDAFRDYGFVRGVTAVFPRNTAGIKGECDFLIAIIFFSFAHFDGKNFCIVAYWLADFEQLGNKAAERANISDCSLRAKDVEKLFGPGRWL